MSVENVMRFWQRVQEESALRQRLEASLRKDDPQEALAQVVRVATEIGLPFSAADYDAARRQIPALLAGEKADTGGFAAGRLVGLGGALAPGGVLRSGGVLRAADLSLPFPSGPRTAGQVKKIR